MRGLLKWGWSGTKPPRRVMPSEPSILSIVTSVIFEETQREFCDAVIKKVKMLTTLITREQIYFMEIFNILNHLKHQRNSLVFVIYSTECFSNILIRICKMPRVNEI